MARKAYRKWPDSTAGVRITSGAKRGISCVTYHDGGRHARRQERMVIDSPVPESAHGDRRGSRERMRAQENETGDGEAVLVRINGDTEIWSQAKTNKGPPYLHRRKEARGDAAMANVPPQAIGRPGAEGNDWASRHTARQAWPLGMVHSVGGARRRKSEYSYRLGGVWEKSPMVRPLTYDRA